MQCQCGEELGEFHRRSDGAIEHDPRAPHPEIFASLNLRDAWIGLGKKPGDSDHDILAPDGALIHQGSCRRLALQAA